jgi:cell division septation protein DedD
LDPAIGRQEDILSWTIPVAIDCDKRLVRLGDMTGYSARDLARGPRVVRPADDAWVTPSSTAPLGAVLRALCDRDFKRPFAAMAKLAAKAAATPAKTPKTPPPSEPPAQGQAQARPAATIAHGASPYAVQLGASPSQDDAKGLLARAQRRFPDLTGLKAETVSANVAGKTVYRALISGFAGAADANALCERLKAAGQACFVRR